MFQKAEAPVTMKLHKRHQSVLFGAHHVRPDTSDPFKNFKKRQLRRKPRSSKFTCYVSYPCCLWAISGNPMEAPGNPGTPKETSETLGNQNRKPRAHGHHRECENIQFGLIWQRPLVHLHMNKQGTCANLLSKHVLPPEPFLPFIVWSMKIGSTHS